MIGHFVQQVLAIADGELRKLRRDPTEVFTRSLQPILWLLVFGEVFSRVRAIPTGTMRYLDFMAPGVLAQSVLFTAIFYGIAIIWERDLGIVHKMLVSPAYRSALVLGKAVSAGVRGLSQTVIIYAVTLLLGIHLRLQILPVLGVIFSVLLGSAVFSTFSLIIACVVKTRERFMGRPRPPPGRRSGSSRNDPSAQMPSGWLRCPGRPIHRKPRLRSARHGERPWPFRGAGFPRHLRRPL